VLVESPIDAMSLAVLERTDSVKTLYLSTDGAGGIPIEYLKEVKDVVIAFDRDRSGQSIAERIKTQLPNAVSKTPKAIDWNQDLVNTFDWANQNQNRSHEINRQPRHKPDTGRGLSL
jgi:5S rRNA maturation endonuclease (ribonuclease M5)